MIKCRIMDVCGTSTTSSCNSAVTQATSQSTINIGLDKTLTRQNKWRRQRHRQVSANTAFHFSICLRSSTNPPNIDKWNVENVLTTLRQPRATCEYITNTHTQTFAEPFLLKSNRTTTGTDSSASMRQQSRHNSKCVPIDSRCGCQS